MKISIDDIFNSLKLGAWQCRKNIMNLHSNKEFSYTLAHFNCAYGDAVVRMDTPILELFSKDIFCISNLVANIDMALGNLSTLLEQCQTNISSLCKILHSPFIDICEKYSSNGKMPEDGVYTQIFNFIVKGEGQEEFKDFIKNMDSKSVSNLTKKIEEISGPLEERVSSILLSFETLFHDYKCLISIFHEESINNMFGIPCINNQMDTFFEEFRIHLEELSVSVIEVKYNYKNMLLYFSQASNKSLSKSESDLNKNQPSKPKCDTKRLLNFIATKSFFGSNLINYIDPEVVNKKSKSDANSALYKAGSENKKDSKIICIDRSIQIIRKRSQECTATN